MKHQLASLRTIAACLVAIFAGAGTAQAQDPQTKPLTPGPDASCPGPETETCPPPAPPPQPTTTNEAPPPAPSPPPESEEHKAYSQMKEYGIGLSAGGGVSDYLDSGLRNITGVSGTWELRGYVGLNKPLGLEVAYVGRASSLTPVFGNISTNLVGNGVEAVGRLNIFHDLVVQPYGIIGIGWMHFSSTNSTTLADTGVNNTDDTLVVPLGAGVSYVGPYNLLFDTRFTFRATLNDSMVVGTVPTINGQPVVATQFLDMDTWEWSARIGYQF